MGITAITMTSLSQSGNMTTVYQTKLQHTLPIIPYSTMKYRVQHGKTDDFLGKTGGIDGMWLFS